MKCQGSAQVQVSTPLIWEIYIRKPRLLSPEIMNLFTYSLSQSMTNIDINRQLAFK